MPKTWYSGLGVSSQADSETIRQRYLELVRRFPPDTHPEDFAEIRQAYDVLNDVKARRRDDRDQFYGTT
ncbi:MAG: J domain-containing protein [Firmicutes bacterium]|nr:J domain-containing protein [Bacillota bacterium]